MKDPSTVLDTSDALYWVNVAFLIAGGFLAVVSFIVQSLKPAKYGKFARPDIKNPYVETSMGSDAKSEKSSLVSSPTPAAAAAAGGGGSGNNSVEENGFNARLSFVITDFFVVVPMWVIVYFVFYEKYQPSGLSHMPPVSIVLFIFWLVHFIHRGLIHPAILRYSMKKVGWDIFIPMIPGNGIFTFVNASMLATTDFPHDYESDPRFIIGVFLFIFGFITNRWADWKLRNLRVPGDRNYHIPKGGLYEFISCPNYFGEMTEWLGYMICAWNWASVVWFAFVASTFLPRARQNHNFYKSTFPDYPKQRRALIPFIY